jgi:uncharacterized protein YutD
MDTALFYALEFAKRGWPVFPCQRNKKPQPGMKWTEMSTTDKAQIEAWAKEYPNTWFGVDCRKAGLFILDLDVKDGKFKGESSLATLEANHERLPDTFTVRTPSGGKHIYFIGQGKNSAGELGEGLDVRSDGGYVIAPNDQYSIVSAAGCLIHHVPDWLAKASGKRGEKSELHGTTVYEATDSDVAKAAAWLIHDAPACVEGGRDKTTYKVAAYLWEKFGLSYAQAHTLMRDVWLSRNDHILGDWSEHDLVKKLNSVYSGNVQKGRGEGHPAAQFGVLAGASPVPESERSGVPPVAETEPEHVVPAGGSDIDLDIADLDIENTPPRDWLMEGRYVGGYITATIAPGGSSKSTLGFLEALAIATGKSLTGLEVKQRAPVWVYNTEDPLDELKMRVDAVLKEYGYNAEQLRGFFKITSGRVNPMKLVKIHRGQPIVNEPLVEYFIDLINRKGYKLWIIDPLVKTHEVSENDNMAMDLVMIQFSRIAEATGCSISIVHHTRKIGKDGGIGDVETSRGAKAVTDACRIVHTLNVLPEGAEQEYVLYHAPSWYVRLDTAKGNLMAPGEGTVFYERVSKTLKNGEKVGTLKHVELVERAPQEECDADNWLIHEAALLVSKNGSQSLSTLAKIIKEVWGDKRTLPGAKKLTDRLKELYEVDYMDPDKKKWYCLTDGGRKLMEKE